MPTQGALREALLLDSTSSRRANAVDAILAAGLLENDEVFDELTFDQLALAQHSPEYSATLETSNLSQKKWRQDFETTDSELTKINSKKEIHPWLSDELLEKVFG